METTTKIPIYTRTASIFICVIAFVFILQVSREIMIPIVYATIIAILLNPFVTFLIRKKIRKEVAISIAVFLTISVVLAIAVMLYTRIEMFTESYPQLKEKFNATSKELIRWASRNLNVHQWQIKAWMTDSQASAINEFAVMKSLTEVGRLFVVIMLLPVYLFMILYYKPLLLEFTYRLFRAKHHDAVVEVLTNTKQIIQSYLVGLFFEFIIMAILHTGGLLMLGIEYAIVLGVLGAVLNIIPYIGGVTATALAMVIAFVTKDSLTYPILVLILYILIQFVDNNFIIPRIVASRVHINALVSVIVVIIGGAIWGISGMFLSIPLTAIVKVICDHIEPLKPWGFLLGNVVPTASKFSFIRRRTMVVSASS